MLATRRLRLLGSIALSLLLFAGMPALALADQPPVDPNVGPSISGTVTDHSSGDPIANISVAFEDAVTHDYTGPVLTNASGAYYKALSSGSYIVHFSDSAAKYLSGTYNTGDMGNIDLASGSAMPVVVGIGSTTNINVAMFAAVHLTGKITGPGTPPNPLSGIGVDVTTLDPYFTTWTTTADDGTFSLLVMANANYFWVLNGQDLYDQPCAAPAVVPNLPDCEQLEVGSSDTVSNTQMLLAAGDVLTITPDGATVAAGSSQTYTATLTNPNPPKYEFVPAGGKISTADLSDVTASTVFSMVGGTCTGAVCTPSTAGDHPVSGTYGSATGSVTLHTPAAPATPTPAPTAAPTAAPTPPPTSTNSSSGGGGSPLMVLFLMALTGASVTLFTVRRLIRGRR